MLISKALDLRRGEVITFVGGGGKTTCMYRLAQELKSAGKKIVVTTTTKIILPHKGQVEKTVLSADETQLYQEVKRELKYHDLLAAGTGITPEGKMREVSPDFITKLKHLRIDYILIEGDGAAGKPFKAPAAYEPVIAEATTLVIPVVGIDGLGYPLDKMHVHRPEQINRLTGLPLGQVISEHTVTKVFTHPEGYQKGVPAHARWIPLINKVEDEKSLAAAVRLGQQLVWGGAEKVLLGAVATADPIRKVLEGGGQ